MFLKTFHELLRGLKSKIAGLFGKRFPPPAGGGPSQKGGGLRTLAWSAVVCCGFVGIALLGSWALGEFDDHSNVASPPVSYIRIDGNQTAWVMIPDPKTIGSYTVEAYKPDPVLRTYAAPDSVSHASLLHSANGAYARKVGDGIQALQVWDATHRPQGCESATVEECVKLFAAKQNTPSSAGRPIVAIAPRTELATIFLPDWRVEIFVPEAVEPRYSTKNEKSGATLERRMDNVWDRQLPDGSITELHNSFAGRSFPDECLGTDSCRPTWADECKTQETCRKEWAKVATTAVVVDRKKCQEEKWVEQTQVDQKTGVKTTTRSKVPPPPECGADDSNQDIGADASWNKWLLGILGATNAFLLQLILPTVFVTFIVWALMNWKRRGSVLPGLPSSMTGALASQSSRSNGNNQNEPNIKITVTKPENNKWRLTDLILNEDTLLELMPFIEAVRSQREATDTLLAEAIKRYKEESKKKADWINEKEFTPAALDVAIPPIPEGRYGFIQNTKWLLAGPPGAGKSLAALVAAGEAGVTLISISGSVANTFIGKDAANVHALVDMAKKHAPCIIFMDEADEAAKQRGKNVGMGGATTDAGTTALLAEIDGIESKSGVHSGVHWMAATNYLDKIDEAIKRSGRLKILNFSMPNLNTLKRLLNLFFGKLKKVPLSPEFEPASNAVASMLLGKTGADVEQLANSFAGVAEETAKSLEKHLTDQGAPAAEVEAQLSTLKFGQKHFIEALLRFLMGRKKEVSEDTFEQSSDTAYHEGLHGLATISTDLLGMLDKKVRLLTVAYRERSLGLMYASFDKEIQSMSIRNIIGDAVIAYAGAMAQLVIHDDTTRWGKELDLHRDSGQTSDNQQAAQRIHQAIATFGGSLEIGPIFKGQGGNTWFTEMGPSLVDDIDKQVRVYQKLAQFLAWHIASILIRSDVVWEMFDEVLNSPDRIILQDRFYQYWDRIIADGKVRNRLLELPGVYMKMAEKRRWVRLPNPQGNALSTRAEEPAILSWMPERQSWFARRYIRRQINWLQGRYEDTQRRLGKTEGESSDMEGLIAAACADAPPVVAIAGEKPPAE